MSWLTRILYLLGALYLTYWLYYILYMDMILSVYYLVPGIIFLVMVFIFAPQINYFFWKRYTPQLYPFEKEWLEKHNPFYRKLNPEEKKKFGQRVFLFQKSIETEVKGLDTLPRDFLSSISCQQVMLTFGMDNYLTEPYERFIIYRTHFPSPMLPERHASESHDGDKVVIFAGNQLLFSIQEPDKFFSVGIYELTRILRRNLSNTVFPLISQDEMSLIDQAAPYTRQDASRQCNQSLDDDFAYAVHHFFYFGEQMKELSFSTYEKIRLFLKLKD